jgi:hypothetical protein
LARPSAHPEHADRIANADLSYPLHVIRRRERWLILDGIHRLTKAEMLGLSGIVVSTLTAKDLASVVRHATPAPDRRASRPQTRRADDQHRCPNHRRGAARTWRHKYRLAMNEELANELAEMAAEDQRIRKRSMAPGRGFVRRLDADTAKEYMRIDAENAERLRQIVAEHGWPGRSLVGEQGAHDAWLIAQHADRQPEFQRQALELLADAVARGEASARDLAYLTDRVRVNEGRKQVFGTQIMGVEDGVPVPRPIEDRERLDERRTEVGLEPFDQYTGRFAKRFEED